MAGGLGSHLAYRESNLSISVYPARLQYLSILFLNILTLLAPTQSADNLFHSFPFLCENFQIFKYPVYTASLLM